MENEEVMAVKRAISVVKSTRSSAAEREQSSAVLASRGINPKDPEGPVRPFRHLTTMYFPAGFDKAAAREFLKTAKNVSR